MVYVRNGSNSSTSIEAMSTKLPGSVGKADVELGTVNISGSSQEPVPLSSPSAVPAIAEGPPQPPADKAPEEDEAETYISVSYLDILKHWSLMGYIGAPRLRRNLSPHASFHSASTQRPNLISRCVNRSLDHRIRWASGSYR